MRKSNGRSNWALPMSRLALAVAVAGFALSNPAVAQKRTVTDEEVKRVHQSLLLIDSHNDLPMKTVDGLDVGLRSAVAHTDIPKMREGGVGSTFFAAYVAADYVKGNRSAWRAMEMIDSIRRDMVGRYPNEFALALKADDVEAARRAGKMAVVIGLEGGHALEDSLRLLRIYHTLGVRYVTLTHSNTNNWADSCGDINRTDIQHHNGLTDFGKDVIREMNRLGVMVDVAHVSDKTFWDALETSKAPILSTHSSCRALASAPRNMTDEMIVALAKKGGVIQINFSCGFLSQRYIDQTAEVRRRAEEAAKASGANPDEVRKRIVAELSAVPKATLGDVVEHINHVVKIAGIDAVGIGSDFDGIGCTPAGLDDVSKYPNLTRALLEQGYSPADIGKIYSGNILRVMRAVEKTAAR